MTRVLIAGMGNVLRHDDGLGVEIARRLAERGTWPTTVRVIEIGTGGIHLVQELMDGYDLLIVVDAVERGSEPGTVHVLEAEVPDLETWDEDRRNDFLADMHYTTPTRAMILAKALGILPPRTLIVGCQPEDARSLGIGLSEPVEHGIHAAIREIQELVSSASAERA